MLTTGIDLVEIDRMKKSLANPRFLTRVFSLSEIALLEEHRFSAQTAAANFAAKEAFSKALGTGVRGFRLCEVSVLRDGLGKPYLALEGRAKQLAEEKGLVFSLSLTHTDQTAAAFVIGYPADLFGAKR